MANSKYQYVRSFEQNETLLPNTWIVIRLDGRSFHKLSEHYAFAKPNDLAALRLMNAAAQHVLARVPDVCLAYGVSDEYSFVFHRSTGLFERRREKLVSTVVSTFTSAYVHFWEGIMGNERNLEGDWLPSFDGRTVCFPTVGNLRDYLSWRQVDCHINNLYNTVFWALVVQAGMGVREAEEELKGTLAADKNEILWTRFGINYNDEEEMFKKGSVVFREYQLENGSERGDDVAVEMSMADQVNEEQQLSRTQREKTEKGKKKAEIVVRHVDIIRDEFWDRRPWILSGKPGRLPSKDG